MPIFQEPDAELETGSNGHYGWPLESNIHYETSTLSLNDKAASEDDMEMDFSNDHEPLNCQSRFGQPPVSPSPMSTRERDRLIQSIKRDQNRRNRRFFNAELNKNVRKISEAYITDRFLLPV
jgi:hypothetical protein